MTERDGLHMAIERFGDLDVFAEHERELGRTMTLDDVIAAEMATITAPLAEVRDWLVEHVRVRRGFRELAAEHDPLIVSSGFHELIEPILEREGVRAHVVANHVVDGPDGWEARFSDGAPCDLCGERCKRGAVAGIGRFAYAGDGYSDRCVALAAELVFARDGLAHWLDEQGVAYERFDDFVQMGRALATPAPPLSSRRR